MVAKLKCSVDLSGLRVTLETVPVQSAPVQSIWTHWRAELFGIVMGTTQMVHDGVRWLTQVLVWLSHPISPADCAKLLP